MLRPLPARLSVLCLVLTLGACSATPDRGQSWPSGDRSASSLLVADGISRENTGRLLELPASNALGVSSVNVLHEYQAASGRLCRRVAVPQNNAIRVMCERGKGDWSFTRALVGAEGNAQVAVVGTPGSLGTAVRVTGKSLRAKSIASMPAVVEEVGEGESLWRFAARTTGDPLNWELIAELNDIDSPYRVRPGEELSVPAHLLTGQY